MLEIELKDLWDPSFDGWAEYLKAFSADLRRFVGDAPEDKLEIIGDGGDEHWQARALGYVCTGSRYYFGEHRFQNSLSKWTLGPADVEMLKEGDCSHD